MVTCFTMFLGPLRGASFRYALLERAGVLAARCGVTVLAFGFTADDARWVLRGELEAVAAWVKAMRVGTSLSASALGVDLSGQTVAPAVRPLVEAVVWAHSAPVEAGAADVLSSPWSSHRDLLCFREAAFFDGKALRASVDARAIHAALHGEPLPAGWPPSEFRTENLPMLLRVSGAVIGLLPADRRCFRLFAHLAKARGFQAAHVARALALTTRRVRQLFAEPEPRVSLALIALSDMRLRVVP